MHSDIYKRPLLWCLAALIIGLVLFYRPAPSSRDVFHFIPQKTVTLTGRVESFAVSKKKSQNVVLKVSAVDGAPTQGLVYARLTDFDPQWKDTLQITGRLQEPYGIDLLGNFNWRGYLATKNIFTEIKSSRVEVMHQAAWPFRAIRAVRADILRVFNEAFSPELAGIAGGVLLGERGELPPSLFTAFQDSGAIHLLVASGGNVGFVTLVTLALCGLIGVRRKKGLLLALCVAGVYTLIAGADAPLVRAYFMAASACVGYLLGRNSGVFQGLLVSCFLILCVAPASVFETGFQMSFLATLAIILCLNNYQIPVKWPKWVRFFAQIFLATLSTQLALLPVFTNVFYKVSLTGLVSNMILVPLASLLMGLSFVYYLFCKLHVGWLLFYPTLGCLEIFRYLVEFFASFRFSALPVSAWRGGTVAAYYIGLFWLFNWPLKNLSKKILWPSVVAVVLLLGAGRMVFAPKRVYLLNEWNKGAVLVQLAKNEVFVFYDGLEREKITAALRKIGVSQASAEFYLTVPKKEKDPTNLRLLPFVQAWPGESWRVGDTHVTMRWGLHRAKDGHLWENTGYSGTDKDDVSYCVTRSGKEVCVGARARFVQAGGKIAERERNKTVLLKI